jgi:hypothetical protein
VAHRSFPFLRGRLFTIISALSLLLCLATLALWVRSYWVNDDLQYLRQPSSASFGMQGNCGELVLSVFQFPSYAIDGVWTYDEYVSAAEQRFSQPGEGDPAIWVLGFGFDYRPQDVIPASFIFFPHWSLAILLAILPAIHLRAILRARRRNRIGLCRNCGYDLRATPDRCPECGTVPNCRQEAHQ